jgi:hypothetical protein
LNGWNDSGSVKASARHASLSQGQIHKKMQRSPAAPSGRTRSFGIVAGNLAVILVVLTAAAVVPRGGKALVFVAPWSEPDRVLEVIQSAGGSLLNGTGAPYAAIAQSDEPYFAFRLFKSGALFVLDGSLAYFCRSTPSQ